MCKTVGIEGYQYESLSTCSLGPLQLSGRHRRAVLLGATPEATVLFHCMTTGLWIVRLRNFSVLWNSRAASTVMNGRS